MSQIPRHAVVDLIIMRGEVAVSEREKRKVLFSFFFFVSGVQTSVDATTPCLRVPAQSWLSVIQECAIHWAPEM